MTTKMCSVIPDKLDELSIQRVLVKNTNMGENTLRERWSGMCEPEMECAAGGE